MKHRHQATRAAIELIKRFEGFRPKSAQLPDGGWTIGYGHTRTARAGKVIGEADADALLIYDVAGVVTALNEWVYSPLTQNQFDALVAFGFNIGLPNLRRSSVLRRLNEGQHLQAACAMEMWRTADFEGERIVIDALVRRRSAEMALFLTPQEGYIPVPSLIVLPRVDEQVARLAPWASTQIETSMEGAVAAMVRRDETEQPEPAAASRAAAQAISDRLNALLQDLNGDSVAPEPVVAEAEPAIGAALPLVEEEPAAFVEPETIRAVAEAAYEPVIHAEWSEEFVAHEPKPHEVANPGFEAYAPEIYEPEAYEAATTHAEVEAEPEPEPVVQETVADVAAEPIHETTHEEHREEDEPSEPENLSFHTHEGMQPLIFHSRPTGSLTMRRRSKRAATEPALALMGVVGLAVAGGGVFWGVSAHAAERLPLLPDPQVTGFGVAVAGIVMLSSSVYLLLRRLADRES